MHASSPGVSGDGSRGDCGVQVFDDVVSCCVCGDVGAECNGAVECDVKSCRDNGLLEYCYYVKRVREKFDSAASMNMSGNKQRLKPLSVVPVNGGVGINGFNGSLSMVTNVGVNNDDKREYHVKDMPEDLALLCAHMYASDGAAILFKDGGVVLSLSDVELAELKQSISDYTVFKRLKVVNRTYEVANDDVDVVQCDDGNAVIDVAMPVATKYFNTKVNVSNDKERVMTMLLTGLSMSDLLACVKHKSLGGMPVDLTLSALGRFENKYGRTPDIVRMANPLDLKSRYGLMSFDAVNKPGDRLEVDVMKLCSVIIMRLKMAKLKSCFHMVVPHVLLCVLMLSLVMSWVYYVKILAGV